LLKILGVILVITASSAIGFYFSSLAKARVEDLKELRKCIYILKGDIRYSATPLPEAIQMVALKIESNLSPFFQKIADELNKLEGRTLSSIWTSSVNTQLDRCCLNKKDKMYLIQFGESMGYLDKDTQINTIDLYISQLDTEIDEMITSVKEKTRLYNLLGIMGGIFMTIIII
jgi:stage III sporulation protein AB